MATLGELVERERSKQRTLGDVVKQVEAEKQQQSQSSGFNPLHTGAVGASGFNKGAGGLAGLPVDLMNKALSLVGLGSQEPVLGSEWIMRNIMPNPIKPEGTLETYMEAVGEQVPAMLPGIGLASRTMPIAKTIVDATKVGLGAGLGSGTARTITDNPYVDIASQLIGGMAGGATIPKAITPQTITQETGQIIEKGIEKGVRPSVINKATASATKNYMDRAKVAVEKIVENKGNLNLTDEAGLPVKGQLPQNLKQFSEAVEQTRQSIFKKYDTMTKQAGQRRAVVDLDSIANELDVIANNPVIQREAPSTAAYAKSRADAYRAQTYTTEEAQSAIAVNNRRLKVLPTYADANHAWVDSLINNRLRHDLDNVIESAVGPGYQQLKNEYGALKAIEKDVVHRSIVDSRKSPQGFFDLGNILSGYEAVRGILTFNPAAIGASAASKGVVEYMKFLNNPNRIVRNMFADVEGVVSKGTRPSGRGIMMGAEALKQTEKR